MCTLGAVTPARPPAPIIQLESFEGPLDLLLQLVERRRLPIAELSLVAVADQYLAQVRALPRVEPGRALRVPGDRRAAAAAEVALAAAGHRAAGRARERRGDGRRRPGASAGSVPGVPAASPRSSGDSTRAATSSFSGGARPAEPAPEAAALQAIAPALLASLYAAIERRRAAPPVAELTRPEPRASVAERIVLLRDRLARCGPRRLAGDLRRPQSTRSSRRCWPCWSSSGAARLSIVQPDLFGPITLRRATPSPESP